MRGRARAWPEVLLPGFRDIRGYQAMYRDFARSIRTGSPPEMCLEAAMADQRLMERITATVDAAAGRPAVTESCMAGGATDAAADAAERGTDRSAGGAPSGG